MMRSSLFTIMTLAAILVAQGCSGRHENGTGPVATAGVVKGVTLASVKATAIPDQLEVVGTIRSRTCATVSARIPGTVSVLKVREGDRVKKGQLLALLDARENQATAAAAEAGIEEAHRGLEESRARKQLADITFDRYQKLFQEQAVTRQELDTRQSEKELAAQGVARSEARFRQATEGARAAGAVADYTKISAPISGIITARQVDLGATVFPAQPLMTIEDDGSYQLELAVPEAMSARVKPGTAVRVTIDALAVTSGATVAELVPASDPASRTFTAKVNLSQKGLKSGMFGRGAISLGGSTNCIMVSRTAVNERGALTSVWVVDKDKAARMRLVKTGKTTGDRIEILSGLSDGDLVIVSGGEKVSEGVRVE